MSFDSDEFAAASSSSPRISTSLLSGGRKSNSPSSLSTSCSGLYSILLFLPFLWALPDIALKFSQSGCVFSCLLHSRFLMNPSPQTLQRWLKECESLLCLVRWFLVPNALPQTSHTNGLPLCVTTCLARVLELENDSPQIVHVCSVLYSWNTSWAASRPCVGKFFPHVVQMYLSSALPVGRTETRFITEDSEEVSLLSFTCSLGGGLAGGT